MRVAVSLLLLMLSLPASAQVYRWVDAQGKVHYTQTPPPQGRYKEVPPAPPPGQLGGAPNLGEYAGKLQNEREKREQAQETAQKTAERRRHNCSSARRNRATLDRYEGRLFSATEDGGRERWTPEQIAAERAHADQVMAENCD